MLVNVAVGYGGRREIADAVRSLLQEHASQGTSIEELAEVIDVEHIAEHLYTKGQPDPDLVIRTSGEQRLGGFLLWQSAHSEFYFCEAYWPDFRKVDFLRALRAFGGAAPALRLLTPTARHPRRPDAASRASSAPLVTRVPPGAERAEKRADTRSPTCAAALPRSRSVETTEVLTPGATMASSTRSAAQSRPGKEPRRTYVLDTSVLLSDPRAITRFKEHEVVLPVVVVTELEAKRHHPELGYFARKALRLLDDLRISAGRLDAPVPIGDDGGTLRVELNHTDPTSLPAGFRLGDNDTRILAVARNLANEGRDVTIVSKDLPMRVKASACGLEAEEYRAELAVESGWTGMAELDVTVEEMDHLYEYGRLESVEAAELPCHTGLELMSPRGSRARPGRGRQAGAARARRPGRVRPARPQRRAAHRPRPADGPRRRHRQPRRPRRHRQVGARAVRRASRRSWSAASSARSSSSARSTPSAARSSATCPGTEAEKMNPWGQAVFDTLSALVSREVVEEILDRGMLEVLPLTHIRGRSLHDAFVIVDEAQSLERNVLLTVLSRIGQNSRVVLTHDVAQRDNLRVGRHDGVVAVVEALKGHPLFAHVTLTAVRAQPDRGPGDGPARGHRGLSAVLGRRGVP